MTNKKEKVGNAFCHIYLIVLSLIAVFPLVWVLLCSVKSSGELTSNPTRFFPKHFTLENFTHVIQDLGFAKNIGNSLIIAIITTGIAIVISSMAAYGIVRFFPKLGSIMSKVLVATYMFPPILLAIPYSMVMAKLGLVNTRIGLIIVYLSFSVPYGKDEHFLVHESQEEDDDRTRIYHSTEMDGAIMYGKPGKKPPMWLHSIMKNEMKYLNGILHGKEVDEEFRPLLTGEAARAAIATADACTRSRFEDRKVKLSEIIG